MNHAQRATASHFFNSLLEDWISSHPFEAGAAVSFRVALRGVRPLFDGDGNLRENLRTLRALNASIVRLVLPEHDAGLKSALRAFLSTNRVVDVETSIERLKHYEAASARRRSRASSADETLADGVLRQVSDYTDTKYRRAQERAVKSVAAAMGALSADAILNRRRLVAAASYLNGAVPTDRRASLWNAVSADSVFLDRTARFSAIFEQPLLWEHGTSPVKIWPTTDALQFWIYWYRGFEIGRPLDWHMLADIALAEAEYDFSSDAVLASKLREIEIEHLRRVAYQPETVVVDQNTGLFRIEAGSVKSPVRYQNAIRKVSDDIIDIKRRISRNAYGAIVDILETIARNIEEHHKEPMFMHDDFLKAARMIIRRVDRDELPASDEWIENLVEDLGTASIDIQGIDPDVAKAVNSRVRIKARRPNEEEERSLSRQIELRSRQSEPILAKQLNEDHRALVDLSPAAESEPEQAAQRMANLLSQMEMHDGTARKDNLTKRVVEASEVASKIQKGVQATEYGYTWIKYLMSMF